VAAAAAWPAAFEAPAGEAPALPPIATFSKVFQELKLSYDESAEITAAVGLDGVDCPVRPGGQVAPERVGEELPRYVEALGKRKLRLLLLTTAILSPATPHAETILRLARQFGVKYYRLGYWNYRNGETPGRLLREIQAQLKDLERLNRELGMCAIFQNHSGGGIVGAKVRDMYEAVRCCDPEFVGIAFDLSHALIELGEDWRTAFNELRSHFRIAYVKDVKRPSHFCRFGEGELGPSGFFKLLASLGYRAPVSMHTEYDWEGKGNPKTREALTKALGDDLGVLRRWLAAGA
jgi:sugar phosphate isomerase/epimerase